MCNNKCRWARTNRTAFPSPHKDTPSADAADNKYLRFSRDGENIVVEDTHTGQTIGVIEDKSGIYWETM